MPTLLECENCGRLDDQLIDIKIRKKLFLFKSAESYVKWCEECVTLHNNKKTKELIDKNREYLQEQPKK